MPPAIVQSLFKENQKTNTIIILFFFFLFQVSELSIHLEEKQLNAFYRTKNYVVCSQLATMGFRTHTHIGTVAKRPKILPKKIDFQNSVFIIYRNI